MLIHVITTAPSDLASLTETQQLFDDVLARWPMMGLWIIAHHGAPFPDSDFRRNVGPMFRPYRDRQFVVITPLGLGFWASTAAAFTFTLGKLLNQMPALETSIERGAERLGRELIGVDPEKLIESHRLLLDGIQSRAKVA